MNKFLKGVKILGDIAFSVFMLGLGSILIMSIIFDYGWFSIIMIPVLLGATGIIFIAMTLLMLYCTYVFQNKKFTGFIKQMTINSKQN